VLVLEKRLIGGGGGVSVVVFRWWGFTTTHYVVVNKISHVYFNHMTYLMSHVISLNNTCGWSYKLPRSGL
jgi:hypothetical protein